jgi:hypothetical protein
MIRNAIVVGIRYADQKRLCHANRPVLEGTPRSRIIHHMHVHADWLRIEPLARDGP